MYKTKPKTALHVSDLSVLELVNTGFNAAAEYLNYRLLNMSSHHDNDVVQDFQEMVNCIAVQMKDCIYSGKYRMLVIAFSQEIKSTCDACRIHQGAAM